MFNRLKSDLHVFDPEKYLLMAKAVVENHQPVSAPQIASPPPSSHPSQMVSPSPKELVVFHVLRHI